MKKIIGFLLSLIVVLVLFSFDFSVVKLVQGKPGEYNIIGNIIESKEPLSLKENLNSTHVFLEGAVEAEIEDGIKSSYITNGRINHDRIAINPGSHSVKITISRGFTKRFLEYSYSIFASSDLLIEAVGYEESEADFAYRIKITNNSLTNLRKIKNVSMQLINKTNGHILAVTEPTDMDISINSGSFAYATLLISTDELLSNELTRFFDCKKIIIASSYSSI